MDDLVVLIDRWMKHATYGVEAMLDKVPRNDPEGGEYDLPDAPEVFNDQECEELINGGPPPASPALVVIGYRDMDLPESNRTVQISNNAIVAIGYVTNGVGTVTARRESGYVLRAVKKSLHAFNNQTYSKGFRELNGTMIAAVRSVRYARSARGVGSSQIWGFVLATLDVMDKLP